MLCGALPSGALPSGALPSGALLLGAPHAGRVAGEQDLRALRPTPFRGRSMLFR
ncbi:hypothetical protein [Kribbella sp. NPDC048928]|uniref:hypothetical protein n=1 Tax=Kribbella sp. NPDC048928 TaxID=3364111 RepID=UPI00371F9701